MVVNYGNVLRSYVEVSNLNDENRTSDVTAVAWVNTDGVTSLERGIVVTDGVECASFFYYDIDHLSVDFKCDHDHQEQVLDTIHQFAAACKALPGVDTM